MRRRAAVAAMAAMAAAGLLPSCTTDKPSVTATRASARPPATTATRPVPTAIASRPVPTVSPTYKHTATELLRALPPSYKDQRFGRPQTDPIDPDADFNPRPDALFGETVLPEICRLEVQIGRDQHTFERYPRDVPSVFEFIYRDAQNVVSVGLFSLHSDWATDYMKREFQVSPECAHFKVGDSIKMVDASVTVQAVPDFGTDSRYRITTYPIQGSPWTERTLLFRTSEYVADVRVYGEMGDENDLFTLARQIRQRADRVLGS